ncbi:PIN domain-containing protein [Actinomycetospora endophytica]|uniref:PIN domain-containing protein n=1 Tax=Actinomycetospora endophytica TaxID=2291215 RepID=A0ABS8PJ43_9PSEU|nr:PIN domain-containing protein [Actinomycetospora endophytica]MCD2198058.1 PIN domain-containing protein [Actinomycetospora endophytica]
MNRLWSDAVVVLDTNSLLNLYRYPDGPRESLFNALGAIKERLWIPHQVAKEFHRNRASVIRSQESVSSQVDQALRNVGEAANKELKPLRRNGLVAITPLLEDIEKAVTAARDAVGHQVYMVKPQKDSVLERVADLYEGRVGEPFSEEHRKEATEEAVERYEAEVPPGYKDTKKSENSYGDYFVWKQIMRYASSVDKDILLVTDDRKEDWWWSDSGYSLGPLPALRKEFSSTTSHFIWFYTPSRFLVEMRERGLTAVSDEDISVVRETTTPDRPISLEKDGIDHLSVGELERLRVDLKQRIDETNLAQGDLDDRVRELEEGWQHSSEEQDRVQSLVDEMQRRASYLRREIRTAGDNTDERVEVLKADLEGLERVIAKHLDELATLDRMRERQDPRKRVRQLRNRKRALEEQLATVDDSLTRHYSLPE